MDGWNMGRKNPERGPSLYHRNLLTENATFYIQKHFCTTSIKNSGHSYLSLEQRIERIEHINQPYHQSVLGKNQCQIFHEVVIFSWGTKRMAKMPIYHVKKMWFQILGSRQVYYLPHGHYERMFQMDPNIGKAVKKKEIRTYPS